MILLPAKPVIISWISGALLPLVALGFIKSLTDYIKPEETVTEEVLTELPKKEISGGDFTSGLVFKVRASIFAHFCAISTLSCLGENDEYFSKLCSCD